MQVKFSGGTITVMPPPIGTVEATLQRLNTDPHTASLGPWIVLNEYQAMTSVDIGSTINFDPNRGVVVKNFVSSKTGEIRAFLVKLLDVPERGRLYE